MHPFSSFYKQPADTGAVKTILINSWSDLHAPHKKTCWVRDLYCVTHVQNLFNHGCQCMSAAWYSVGDPDPERAPYLSSMEQHTPYIPTTYSLNQSKTLLKPLHYASLYTPASSDVGKMRVCIDTYAYIHTTPLGPDIHIYTYIYMKICTYMYTYLHTYICVYLYI